MRLKTDVANFAAKSNNAVRFAALKPEVAGGAGSRRSDPHDPPTEFTCSSATCSSLLYWKRQDEDDVGVGHIGREPARRDRLSRALPLGVSADSLAPFDGAVRRVDVAIDWTAMVRSSTRHS